MITQELIEKLQKELHESKSELERLHRENFEQSVMIEDLRRRLEVTQMGLQLSTDICETFQKELYKEHVATEVGP